ncbi:MAG: hypothetical protein ACOY32_02645 [Thermodesulfobacteriota bacterium]
MKMAESAAAATNQVRQTTDYQRSREVEVSRQVLREQGAETEISRKTTTQKTIETTRTRREIESQIRRLNQQLDELGRSDMQFELSSADASVIRVVEKSGRTFDLSKSVEEFLATDPALQSGLIIDTVA